MEGEVRADDERHDLLARPQEGEGDEHRRIEQQAHAPDDGEGGREALVEPLRGEAMP